MKKTSQPKAKAKASKPETKSAKAKASAPAPVAAQEKIRSNALATFRLPVELKEALINHAFTAGYGGNASKALCAILGKALG
jgi:hypothetical protein